MTNATTTDERAVQERTSSLVTASTMPRPLGFAFLHGVRAGSITEADLPSHGADQDSWFRQVHHLLDERGVLAAYREDLASHAHVAACPWWCNADDHPFTYSREEVAIWHRIAVARVEFDDKDREPARAYIEQMQDENGRLHDTIEIAVENYTGDAGLNAREAAAMSELFRVAAEQLASINATDEASAVEASEGAQA